MSSFHFQIQIFFLILVLGVQKSYSQEIFTQRCEDGPIPLPELNLQDGCLPLVTEYVGCSTCDGVCTGPGDNPLDEIRVKEEGCNIIQRNIKTTGSCSGQNQTLSLTHFLRYLDTQSPSFVAPSSFSTDCKKKAYSPPCPTCTPQPSFIDASLPAISALDNCDPAPILTFKENYVEGDCPNQGSVSREWETYDKCLNFDLSKYYQTITFDDTIAPVLQNLPSELNFISCETEIPSNLNLTAMDNCDDSFVVVPEVLEDTTSSPFIFNRTFSWTFEDSCQNSNVKRAKYVVIDDVAPILTCPDVVLPDNEISSIPTFSPSISDCDLNVNITQDPIGLIESSNSSIVVTITAVDYSGNIGQCSFLVSPTPLTTVPPTTIPSTTQPPKNRESSASSSLPSLIGIAVGILALF